MVSVRQLKRPRRGHSLVREEHAQEQVEARQRAPISSNGWICMRRQRVIISQAGIHPSSQPEETPRKRERERGPGLNAIRRPRSSRVPVFLICTSTVIITHPRHSLPRPSLTNLTPTLNTYRLCRHRCRCQQCAADATSAVLLAGSASSRAPTAPNPTFHSARLHRVVPRSRNFSSASSRAIRPHRERSTNLRHHLRSFVTGICPSVVSALAAYPAGLPLAPWLTSRQLFPTRLLRCPSRLPSSHAIMPARHDRGQDRRRPVT